MRVVVKKVGELPVRRGIANELHVFQKIVGGNIECFKIFDDILCICNEDGKRLGLKPNFIFGYDTIVGDVFFCSKDGCEFSGLNEEQAEWITTILTKIEKTKK